MKKWFVILNHDLTEEQRKMLSGEIKHYKPGEIDPSADEQEVLEKAKEIIEMIKNYNPDAVICQTEWGLTFTIVDWCLRNDVPVYYFTTKRVVKDLGDGKILREFKPERIRKYEIIKQ